MISYPQRGSLNGLFVRSNELPALEDSATSRAAKDTFDATKINSINCHFLCWQPLLN